VSSWSVALASLKEGVADAWAADDVWFLLTAVGMDDHSLAEAKVAVDVVRAYEPDLSGSRVADLGCGLGRHLFWLRRYAATVLGVDASPRLCDVAQGVVPEATVEVSSFDDLGKFGSFDVVCAFAHSLFLDQTPDTLATTMRRIRGCVPDFGLLVVEAHRPAAGSLRWDAGPHLTVVEDVSLEPAVSRHAFTLVTPEGTRTRVVTSLVVDGASMASAAEEAGFHLESMRAVRYDEGFSTELYFLRAVKGYNFLSDLDAFLESWADERHERNRLPVEWDGDTDGRIKPSGPYALGQGASLSRHAPDFEAAIESGVRPLVLELVRGWNFVTYSSCGGHLVRGGPREVSAQAYVGIVTFSNPQIATIRHLVERVGRDLDVADVVVRVRLRNLYGPSRCYTAADVLLERPEGTPWSAYRIGVLRVVEAMTARLRDLRAEGGV
jgi:SAM-dependent methyltransferase